MEPDNILKGMGFILIAFDISDLLVERTKERRLKGCASPVLLDQYHWQVFYLIYNWIIISNRKFYKKPQSIYWIKLEK